MTGLPALLDLDAVDHDLDGVLELLVELHAVCKLQHLAVDADAAEALFGEVLEQRGELALAALDDGGHDHDAVADGMCHDLVRHLVDRLLLDHLAAGGAVRRAHARVEQAQVVVDLCDGGDCGAGIFGGGLLVDGDGGRLTVTM